MQKCKLCNGLSPIDATFCIECGKSLIIAATDKTKRLSELVLDNGKRYTLYPNADGTSTAHEQSYGSYIEYGNKHQEPKLSPFIRMNKADLPTILKHTNTTVVKTDTGYVLYYLGHKIVLID